MNLNKRALLVITPVVLLSVIVASLVVYELARNFLERQEQSRINNAVTQLAAEFSRYTTFADSYLLSVTQSHALREYFLTVEDDLSDIALTRHLEDGLRNSDAMATDFLGIAIGQRTPEAHVRSYVQLGQDPISSISSPLQDLVLAMVQDGSSERWAYLPNAGSRNLLLKGELFDPQTFAPPLTERASEALLIVLAIEPTQFNTMRQTLEAELGSVFTISTTLQPFSNLTASAPLAAGQFLQISLPRQHLQRQLLPLAGWLLLISLIFSATASLCLYGLVTRYITRPVAELERDLADVLAKRRTELPVHHQGSDEIGGLARTFRTLYQTLSESNQEARRLLERDALSGLYNLNYITQLGPQALQSAKIHGEDIALMYLDLDNFKFVNDKYGHGFGDELLQAFGQSLSDISVMRSAEQQQGPGPVLVAGRVAGDQFCLLLRQKDAASAAQDIGDMLLQQMEEGLHFANARFPITVSIGIAVYPRDGDSFSQLISNADTAMHQAKLQGKNQLAFYSPELAQKLRRRQEIESALKLVNPDAEFKLVYMPLLNVRSGELDGFEALLRWNSDKLGAVEPDEFVPIAESSGVFAMLDEWVISTGLSTYPAIRQMLGRDFKISLNISSAQLKVSNLVEVLDRYAKRFDIAPGNIQLEITETVNVELTSHAHNFLKRLAAAGYLLALDDFGAGFTSLLRIVEYPITMVKFDKVFIQQTLKRGNRQILKPLVELCHSNGMLVTMEGAESQEDIDILRTFDCDFIQGYYLGMPTSLEEMQAAVENLRKNNQPLSG